MTAPGRQSIITSPRPRLVTRNRWAIVALAGLVVIACSPSGPSSEATSASSPTPSTAPTPSGEPTQAPVPSASAVLSISVPTPSPSPAPASPTPTPSKAPTPVPTAPAITAFTAPTTVSCTGGEVVQITLSWQVERAAGVTLSIDGPGKYDDYPVIATVEVPFACSEPQHTYTITSIGGSGPAASQTRTITRS